MAEQQPSPQPQPSREEVYGQQGNEGLYGQGQYDSQGRPDQRTPQAKRIKPAKSQKSDRGSDSSLPTQERDGKQEDQHDAGQHDADIK